MAQDTGVEQWLDRLVVSMIIILVIKERETIVVEVIVRIKEVIKWTMIETTVGDAVDAVEYSGCEFQLVSDDVDRTVVVLFYLPPRQPCLRFMLPHFLH